MADGGTMIASTIVVEQFKQLFWQTAGLPKDREWSGQELQSLVSRLSAKTGKQLQYGNARTMPSGELLEKLVAYNF